MIYESMSNKDYHAFDAINNSGLSVILNEGPEVYNYRKLNKVHEPTTAMLIGSALHKYVLERGDFFNEYIVTDDKKEESVKEKISNKDFDLVQGMADSVTSLDAFKRMRAEIGYKTEVSFITKLSGVLCKARVDCLTLCNIGDVKTTQSVKDFEKSIANYGYHRQAAWYKRILFAEGIEVDDMVFFCVEKNPPHLSEAFIIDKFAEDVGMTELRYALDVYRECKKTGIWGSPKKELSTISLPKWYKPKIGN